MFIAIVVDSMAWGGLEVHTLSIARTLVSRGHVVEIVEFGSTFSERESELNDLGIRLRHIQLGRRVATAGLVCIWRRLRDIHADIVVVQKGWFPTRNWKFDVALRWLAPCRVSIEHSWCVNAAIDEYSGRRFWLRRLWHRTTDHWITRCWNLVITVSVENRENLIRFGFRREMVVAVHNGVDPAKFRPNDLERSRRRIEWGIAKSDLVLGYVGRICEEKGSGDVVLLFLDLVARSESTKSRVHLVLVGDGSMRPSLEAFVSQHNMAEAVHFVGHVDAPWDAYSAIDVFLLPSKTEAFPYSLLEAMGTGCSVIAMGVGGVPEAIGDQAGGWLVPAGDLSAFGFAMFEASRCSASALADMGKRARELVIKNFNESVQLEALARIIESVPTKTG